MSLANGISRIKTGPLSLHTQTAIFISEQLTDARTFLNFLIPEKAFKEFYNFIE
jgi:hypothetical protein